MNAVIPMMISTRDDDIKGDRDLVERLRSHGINVLTVQHFLDKLDTGEV